MLSKFKKWVFGSKVPEKTTLYDKPSSLELKDFLNMYIMQNLEIPTNCKDFGLCTLFTYYYSKNEEPLLTPQLKDKLAKSFPGKYTNLRFPIFDTKLGMNSQTQYFSVDNKHVGRQLELRIQFCKDLLKVL